MSESKQRFTVSAEAARDVLDGLRTPKGRWSLEVRTTKTWRGRRTLLDSEEGLVNGAVDGFEARFRVDECGASLGSLEALLSLPFEVTAVEVTYSRSLRSLASVASLRDVRRLKVCAEKLESLDGLQELPLERVVLEICEALRDIGALAGQQSLAELDLSHCTRLRSLGPLANLPALRWLKLYGCQGLASLDGLQGLDALVDLDLSWCGTVTDLSPIAGLTGLRRLNLSGLEGLGDLGPIRDLVNLEWLSLGSCPKLESLEPLRGLRALTELDLSVAPELSLAPLCSLESLRSLQLDSSRLSSTEGMAGLPSLVSLNLEGSERLERLSDLSTLPALEWLKLQGCTVLEDIAGLAGCRTLRRLDLSYCDRVRDIRPLRGLPVLSEVLLEETKCLDVEEALATLGSLPALSSVMGPLPDARVTAVLAAAAAARSDAKQVAKQMDEWLGVARVRPDSPNLLGALGGAAALLPEAAADAALVELLSLARESNPAGVRPLLAAVLDRVEDGPTGAALREIVEQARGPMGAELLRALSGEATSREEPLAAWVRACLFERTLAAVVGAGADRSPSPTVVEVSEVLARELGGIASFGVADQVLAAALDSLEQGAVHAPVADFVAAFVARRLAGATPATANDILARLGTMATSGRSGLDGATVLGALASGLADCADVGWARARLDDLLERASMHEVDSGELRRHMAASQVRTGRWRDALDTLAGIPGIAERDEAIASLCSELAGGVSMSGAVECAGAITEVQRRTALLVELAPHAATDPEAWGLLLLGLSDHPGAIQRALLAGSAADPRVASRSGGALLVARTSTERRLLDAMCAAVSEADPLLADVLRRRFAMEDR